MNAPADTSGGEQTVIRELPPVAAIGVASIVLVVVGTVYVAAKIPGSPSLAFPWVLVALAALLAVADAVVLSRVAGFPWRTLFRVGRWVLLGYAVIAGMLEYVFVRNDVRGGQLVVMTLLLLVFMLDVVFLLAYSVARYQPSD